VTTYTVDSSCAVGDDGATDTVSALQVGDTVVVLTGGGLTPVTRPLALRATPEPEPAPRHHDTTTPRHHDDRHDDRHHDRHLDGGRT